MKRIIRVFPERTSCTPTDNMVYIGEPDFLIPEHDEVHISCTFTWDREYCRDLQFHWQGMTDKPVILGGPAFGSKVDGFTQGMYVRSNVIFTSRGCNNNCEFCIVPKLEGKLKEIPVTKGNIIQDNNFLQCSREHKEKVFEMLKTQHGILFKGGLETRLIDDHFIDCLDSLYYTRGKKRINRVKELWLACDSDSALDPLREAVKKLQSVGFSQSKIYCYSLIGKDPKMDMDKNEARLQEIFKIGAMPFAQLYQNFKDQKIEYSDGWKHFAKQWSRPAATKAHCLRGTSYK
jgi:hypothetical protein